MTFKHLSSLSSQELVSSTLAISKADVKSGTLSQGIYKRRLYQCMLNLSTAKKCHYQVEAGLELIVHLFFCLHRVSLPSQRRAEGAGRWRSRGAKYTNRKTRSQMAKTTRAEEERI